MDHTAAKRTAAHLSTYLVLHAVAALLVFLLWFALWLEILVPSFGVLISLIAGIPMLYPLAACFLLYKARRRLAEGNPDATRWIRWSMGFALPGSLAVGVSSTLFAITGLSSSVAGSALLFVPFALIGLSSVFVLLRILFKTDVDQLLWAVADQPLDEALTYSEEEEVEFAFETEDAEVESVVAGEPGLNSAAARFTASSPKID